MLSVILLNVVAHRIIVLKKKRKALVQLRVKVIVRLTRFASIKPLTLQHVMTRVGERRREGRGGWGVGVKELALFSKVYFCLCTV